MTSSPITRDRLSTSWAAPGSIERLGGVAGLLVPFSCAAAVAITAASGANLRQNGFPWAAASGAALAAVAVLAVTRVHSQSWSAGSRMAGRATVLGLLGVAGFFAALGVEDLLNTTLGTARFLSDNDTVTAIGTLVASLLSTVLVPLGLILVGAAAYRAHVLDPAGRVGMAAIGPVLLIGALLSGTTDAAWISALWPMLLAGCWALVGLSLLRRTP